MNLISKISVSIAVVAALSGNVYAAKHKKNSNSSSDNNTTEASKNKTPGQQDGAVVSPERMKEAVDLYSAGKFAEAYKIFNALFALKGDDARVNFYLGRCATELKLYDEALEAFERVLMVEP